jgi:hypothetical protein
MGMSRLRATLGWLYALRNAAASGECDSQLQEFTENIFSNCRARIDAAAAEGDRASEDRHLAFW